jgi:hypothetical protein
MEAGNVAALITAAAAVLVAAIQTRSLSTEKRKAASARRELDRIDAVHAERRELVDGWRELVDASRTQWLGISEVLAGVRAELATCEEDRRQFVIDLAKLQVGLERHERLLDTLPLPPQP